MSRQENGVSRGIQSIEIGCRILRVLEQADSALALKDIATAVEMAPSKVRFYIVSFLREALVIQEPLTSRYLLGPLAIRLGLSALRQSDLIAVSREHMVELSDTTGLTVFLSIWGNRGPTIVAKFEGVEHSPANIRVGHVLPLSTSATGAVFCTFLSQREIEPLLELEKPGQIWAVPHPRSPVDRAERLRLVRERGYAASDNQVYEGYTGVSAPVFGAGAELAGALTILGTSSVFANATANQRMIECLKATVDEISREIGHSGGDVRPVSATDPGELP